MRVALVSEHASPLAVLGGTDAGGQNAHVAALAAALAGRGAQVVVHARRDNPDMPRRVRMAGGAVVDHVPAGPAEPVGKDELLPYMDEFAADLRRRWTAQRPDVAHSHFWMSGYATVRAARPLGIPVLHTFHALGVVKKREQGVRDTSPPERWPRSPPTRRSCSAVTRGWPTWRPRSPGRSRPACGARRRIRGTRCCGRAGPATPTARNPIPGWLSSRSARCSARRGACWPAGRSRRPEPFEPRRRGYCAAA